MHVGAAPDHVWAAFRDVGAIHTRLARGFVTDTKLEGDTRIVTFANGVVARERIIDTDDTSGASPTPLSKGGRRIITQPFRLCRKARAAASSGLPTFCRTS
jgi:hypothetical protein